MQYVEDFRNKFLKLKEIEEKYELAGDDLDLVVEEMEHFKVVSPVIGNFSTGKSSLLNAVVGRPLVSVDVTPETAVPAEIYYGENHVYQIHEGRIQEHSLDDLPLKGLTSKNTDVLRIEYDNEFLKQIPSVKIVDLPGFDTSIELHNKVIDQYLPKSLAYLLAVSCDEPVLKQNIVDLLKELKLYKTPIYLVMTKCGRLTEEELAACQNLVLEQLGKILGTELIQYTCTEVYGDVRLGRVKDFLLDIQTSTADIFRCEYSRILRKHARYAEIYLLDIIDKYDMSTSDLENEKEKLERKMENLRKNIRREMDTFQNQTELCIDAAKDKIKEELEEIKTVLIVMVCNGTDISDRVGTVIRNAVAVSVKEEFERRLQTYVENMEQLINVDIDIAGKVPLEQVKLVGDSVIEKLSLKAVPVVMIAIGAAVSGPILAVIGALAGTVTDVIYNIGSDVRRKKMAAQAVTDLIDEVHREASVCVEREIRRYVDNVNIKIMEDMEKQKAVLVKALDDVNQELSLEEESSDRKKQSIEEDLHLVRELAGLKD